MSFPLYICRYISGEVVYAWCLLHINEPMARGEQCAVVISCDPLSVTLER